MKTSFYKCLLLLLAMQVTRGAAQSTQNQPANSPDDQFWVVDGTVNAMVEKGGLLYVGGSFRSASRNTGGGAPVNAATGIPDDDSDRINGYVYTTVADGNGGWFIGGSFTKVGDLPRTNLARIRADHKVDPNWNPGAAGTGSSVQSLCLSDGILYVGGTFQSLGGQPRLNLGAITAASGQVTEWNPSANGPVYALKSLAEVVYAGGDFQNAGGGSHTNIVALNASTGQANAGWNAFIGGIVLALETDQTNLYVGGVFTNVNGTVKNSIASLSAESGVLRTTWSPPVSGFGGQSSPNVLTLKMNPAGTMLFIGGSFFSSGTQALIAVNLTSGAVITTWNSSALTRGFFGGATVVQSLEVSGTSLYVAGTFSSTRTNLAALSVSNGSLIPGFLVYGASAVRSLAASGDSLYVGGTFSRVGGSPRLNLAAFDAATGKLTSWAPNPNNQIRAFIATDNILYVGGDFSTIAGKPHSRLAAFDRHTGELSDWNASVDGSVNTLLLDGNTLYAGGTFSASGGVSRSRVAAFSAITGELSGWVAQVNGSTVNALALLGETLYLGGTFTSVSGTARANLAAVNIFTGAAQSWSANTDGPVSAFFLDGSQLYVGGVFTKIGAANRNSVALLNASNGKAANWNPSADGRVSSILAAGDTVYLGGTFTTLGTETRTGLGAVSAATGAPLPWYPVLLATETPAVSTLVATASQVFAGGDFSSISGSPIRGLAAFPLGGPPPAPGEFHFLSGGVLPNGQYIGLFEVKNRSFIIQSSDDLANWVNLQTVTPTDFKFTDPQAAGLKRRFYRAVQVP